MTEFYIQPTMPSAPRTTSYRLPTLPNRWAPIARPTPGMSTRIGPPVTVTNPNAPKPQPTQMPQVGGFWKRPGVMSQSAYLEQAAAGMGAPGSGGLYDFLKDWATKGGRGIEGGNGADAPYEAVLMDLAARGYDVSSLPEHGYSGPTAEQMGALPADITNLLNMKRSDARAQYASMLAQLDRANADTTRSRDESLRQYGLETGQQRGQMPGSFVGRGIYGSGIWQHALGDFNTGRATGLTNLQSQYLTLLNNIQSQRAGADQTLQSLLSQIDQEELQRKADQIASLKNAGLA